MSYKGDVRDLSYIAHNKGMILKCSSETDGDGTRPYEGVTLSVLLSRDSLIKMVMINILDSGAEFLNISRTSLLPKPLCMILCACAPLLSWHCAESGCGGLLAELLFVI